MVRIHKEKGTGGRPLGHLPAALQCQIELRETTPTETKTEQNRIPSINLAKYMSYCDFGKIYIYLSKTN